MMTSVQAAGSDLVIGVTGHRSILHTEEIANALDRVLDSICSTWPDRRIVILSALAEGADRIVVQHILSRIPAWFVAVLPMEAEEYSQDFPSPLSQRRFWQLLKMADEIVNLPRCDDRPHAYAAAGERILSQTDVLVALWDGNPARGLGGTGDVVGRASELGLPVAWIHCPRNEGGEEAKVDTGGGQRLHFQRFP